MKYVVHYQCGGKHFTTQPYDLGAANTLAEHLDECQFENVVVEAIPEIRPEGIEVPW